MKATIFMLVSLSLGMVAVTKTVEAMDAATQVMLSATP